MHYEVELCQPGSGDGGTGAAWRPVSLVRPRTFATLQVAHAHAERLRPKEARIVAVERDGWRRTVDEAGHEQTPGRVEHGLPAGRCTGAPARRTEEVPLIASAGDVPS